MPAIGRAWYAFVRWLVRQTFFRWAGGLIVFGKENVPASGGLILAPVHVSHADPPAVACACPRHLRFMAKEDLFKGLFGKIIASVGAYPLRRGEGDTEALRRTIAMIEAGEAVLVFPEGTRGDGAQMQPFERGVAMLAKRTGAPVVPVGIAGTDKLLPRGGSKPSRHKVTVAFGIPLLYKEASSSLDERSRRETFLRGLEARIVELCNAHGLPIRSSSSSASQSESRAAGTVP